MFWMEISGQRFEGYYSGEGRYKVRFVPKQTGKWRYIVVSPIEELDGLEGNFVSVDPWPGNPQPQDVVPLTNWWSDVSHVDKFEGNSGSPNHLSVAEGIFGGLGKTVEMVG